jgi:RNA polymerase sigma factor
LDALIERIEIAKSATDELDCLITDYMPFIKRIVSDTSNLGMEYDDSLSLAMLTFMNCVKQYDSEKGSFIAFASTSIRNRLIDESRKQTRYIGKVIPLFPDAEDDVSETAEDKASIAIYNQEQEQECLIDEINAFSEQLIQYGITFQELPQICPRQDRARNQCIDIGRFVSKNDEMLDMRYKHRRLAQSALAKEFGLSEKTIEKHRKYIVTIVILIVGDYPLIRAFLPRYKEV